MWDFFLTIDDKLAEIKNILALLILMATAGATMVALWATTTSQKAFKTNVTIYAIWSPIANTTGTQQKISGVLMVNLANVGFRDTKIGWFSFKGRPTFSETQVSIQPVHDYINKKELLLHTGESQNVALMDSQSITAFINSFDLIWFPRLRLHYSKLFFYTPLGEAFPIRLDKSARKEFNNATKNLPFLLKR